MGRRSLPVAITVIAISTALSFAQVIENPAMPLAKDAGRVLDLKEIWRITDESGEFFFKYPQSLQIASDGSIFLAETEQFLKFGPDGMFLKNLYRKGVGPGEIEQEFTFHLGGEDIFIQDMNSQRLWRTDLAGAFEGQIELSKRDYRGFLGVLPEGFLFLRSVWPPPGERTGKLMELLKSLTLVTRDGKGEELLYTFRPLMFLISWAAMAWDPTIIEVDPEKKTLFVCHSSDYLVEAFDIPAKRIIRGFNRKYPRVPHVEPDWERDWRNKYGSPKREFEPDIRGLHVNGSELWVETSTNDKVKGRLIDVFDSKGRFTDSFYLGHGRTLLRAQGDVLFALEKNADETLRIVKYAMN